MVQVEDAAERVREFYRLVAELQALLGSAEEGLTSQSIVGTEVEMIKQQLKDFKVWFSPGYFGILFCTSQQVCFFYCYQKKCNLLEKTPQNYP